MPFLAPPRPRSYGRWGAWAAPPLRLALRRLRREFPFDLVHAHYAAPAGDAVRRARPGVPLVISVHGGDVLSVARRRGGDAAVRDALAGARLVLANSARDRAALPASSARATRASCTSAPTCPPRAAAGGDGARHRRPPGRPQAPRRRPARAVAAARRAPGAALDRRRRRPRAAALERAGGASSGSPAGCDFRGELPPAEAVAAARRGALFVLPSVDEAFGVAYVEAMAGGVPAIGCAGEPGPEEIAAAGGGIRLVPPGDPEALAAELRALLDDAGAGAASSAAQARATVEAAFTWERCGAATVAAYEAALRVTQPVLFVTNHAPPFRVGAFAALHEREDVDVRADRRRRAPRRRRGAATATLPVPGRRGPAQRGVLAARRLGPLPRGGRRAVGPRRAARGLPRRRAAPASRSCCGRRSGRTRARRRTRSPTSRCATSTAHADAVATYGPHVSAYVRAQGRARTSSRRPRASTTRSGRAPADARPARAVPGPVRGPRRGREGRRRAPPGRPAGSTAPRWSGATAELPCVAPGGARGPGAGAAQLLRGQRRCGGAVDPHARLPGAVGPRRQRSLRPGSARDRHRRRRGRRRRPRRSTSAPASSSRRATRGALAAALRRLHGDPALRERLGAGGPRGRRGLLPRGLGGRA